MVKFLRLYNLVLSLENQKVLADPEGPVSFFKLERAGVFSGGFSFAIWLLYLRPNVLYIL